MGKMRDPGWDVLATVLSESTVAVRDIAEHMGVSADDVYDWRRRARNPRLGDIGRLSVVLGLGPWGLASRMGIAPDDRAAMSRVAELDRAITDMQEQERDLYARVYGSGGDRLVADIVEHAVATRRWAVAVWPAVEGPPDCPLQVADRLDFRRTDGAPADVHTLVEDLGEPLRRAGAVTGTAPPRWLPHADGVPDVVQLSVSRFSRKRLIGVGELQPRMRSVAVVGLTVDSWASDTASALAYALGYGLLSTREMFSALDPVGTVADDVQRREAVTDLRRDMHQHLLATPPTRKVWHHVALPGSSTPMLPPAGTAWPAGLTAVWLREDDDLLALRPGTHSPAQRRAAREQTDDLVAAHRAAGAQVVTVQLGRPADYWPGNASRTADWDVAHHLRGRQQKMTDALQAAATVLEHAVEQRWLPAAVPARDVTDDANGALVRAWLARTCAGAAARQSRKRARTSGVGTGQASSRPKMR